jgi:integrase
MADVVRGEDPTTKRRTAAASCLKTFLSDHYEPWVKAHRKSADATIARIKNCFSHFMEKPITEITPWLVEKYRTNRKNEGISKATINRDVGALKAVISKAVEWRVCVENPIANVRPQKTDRQGIVRYLTDGEERRLLQALDEREEQIRHVRTSGNIWRLARGYESLPSLSDGFADQLKPMVLLSRETGLRRGELFQLCWRNVNFETGRITVEGRTSKGGNTLHVPLNQQARNVLLTWRAQTQNPADSLVFPGRDGKSIRCDVRRSWKALLKDADITNFRWHDLRHDFASRLVMAGVDLNIVRELLGHRDIKMTLRYAHLAPHATAQAVARLDKLRQAVPQNANVIALS